MTPQFCGTQTSVRVCAVYVCTPQPETFRRYHGNYSGSLFRTPGTTNITLASHDIMFTSCVRNIQHRPSHLESRSKIHLV